MKPGRLHTITLLPSGERIEIAHGTILSDALLDAGIALETPCGGKGTCRRCRVEIEGRDNAVLSCRERILEDITVHGAQIRTVQNIPDRRIDPESSLALAVDIGTTTVRMSLVDIPNTSCFDISCFLNPQRRYGHDVISRIAAARSDRSAMTALIRKAIHSRLVSFLHAAGLHLDRIAKVVFSGNTTMLYLLFGLDVEPLGRYPYHAGIRDFRGITPSGLGLNGLSSAEVNALPILSAFIGADLVGGLALCRERGIESTSFFIDLGTNGEIFVMNGAGEIFSASCAMGPALEGMNISWGMTASPGAITHIYDQSGDLRYHMIGEGDPSGMTGTALVDLLAILLDRGDISSGGVLAQSTEACSFPTDNLGRGRRLWAEICLTQRDIRNVQLAKAASLSASRFLLEAASMTPEEVEHVFIAGAFGEHLDLDRFERLGFIPCFPNAEREFLGNTSLNAAQKACIDPGFLDRAVSLRDSVKETALSSLPGFQDVFIESLDFPAKRCER